MTIGQIAALGTIAALAAASVSSLSLRQIRSVKPKHETKGRTAVVVELFTSEGCNSCPPADKLLESLFRDQPIEGAQVIALSEHVDYWNNLGWRDPYSASGFSERQNGYVRSLRLQGSYTPQMVVDGNAEFLGSDEGQAQSVISAAANRHKTTIDLRLSDDEHKGMTAKVEIAEPNVNGEVWLALTEDDLKSSVSRGENAGHTLTHIGVVRRMAKIGVTVNGHPFHSEVPVALQSGWSQSKLKLAAFLQQPRQGRILGAAVVSFAH